MTPRSRPKGLPGVEEEGGKTFEKCSPSLQLGPDWGLCSGEPKILNFSKSSNFPDPMKITSACVGTNIFCFLGRLWVVLKGLWSGFLIFDFSDAPSARKKCEFDEKSRKIAQMEVLGAKNHENDDF